MHNDSLWWPLKQKVRKLVAFVTEVKGCLSVKKINSKKQDALKCVAFLTGVEDWLNVDGTAKNNVETVHSPLFSRKIVEIERFPLRAAILHVCQN